ncbi:hypothetical protein L9F63_008915, partial [Diploptera punctata]
IYVFAASTVEILKIPSSRQMLRCTSCERSLNYATKMARILQSSTSMSPAAIPQNKFNISYGAVYDIVHENLKF